jgi:hypothetical protein
MLLRAATLVAQVLAATPHAPCSAVLSWRLPDTKISAAQHMDADPTGRGPVHVGHCKVTGTIGTEIGFAVWLPESWNGRFLMSGGGGYAGYIPLPGPGVDRGFAVTTTDTGHRSDGVDASWALNNLERQLNFAYLATHRTAETAKAIVRQYYGGEAERSYFDGCSTGGRQALMEAQRFPADFDGIIAGAPVYDWTRALGSAIKTAQAAFPDPASVSTPIVTSDNLRLIQRAALDACDAKDGVADGVIDDPRACTFDLKTVRRCDASAAADCLTDAQRAVIARIYSPLTDASGALIYEGQPVGGEAEPGGWDAWMTGANTFLSTGPNLAYAFGTQFFKNFVFSDPAWSYRGYDLASSWRQDTRQMTTLLNAESPDLSGFRGHGGKLLLWHGWADPALNPLATIRYYESVIARDATAAADVRLFMLPGVLHCEGGPGPDQFDRLTAIMDWVEKGQPPSRLIATRRGTTPRTRPLCRYPDVAVYKGSGGTDDAENFSCRSR